MVREETTATKETPLVFIDKSVKLNAKTYQDEVLTKVVAPWKQNNANGVFQQNWSKRIFKKSPTAFA